MIASDCHLEDEYVMQLEMIEEPTGGVYEKGVLKNFAKFTGKHQCQSLFFNKHAGLMLRPDHRCFPVNFAKFLRTCFLQNTSG